MICNEVKCCGGVVVVVDLVAARSVWMLQQVDGKFVCFCAINKCSSFRDARLK